MKLLQSFTRACPARRALQPWAATRGFSASLRAGQFGSNSSGNDPKVLDKAKAKSLKGETVSPHDHAPKWSPDLSSVSEANVKADHAPETSFAELQETTIDYLQATGKSGASAKGRSNQGSATAGKTSKTS